MSETRAFRYVRWIERYKYAVIAASILVSLLAGYIASALPIRTEFANLLPPQRKSVQDLKELKDRIRTFGTVFVVVEGKSPGATAAASAAIAPLLRGIDPDLISRVSDSDEDTRAYFWNNRFLFVSLPDLKEAVSALRTKIQEAKLDANPLFIDLGDDDDDDDDDENSDATSKSEELLARLDKAEAAYKGGGSYLSPDGLVQLYVLRTTTTSTDFSRSTRLLAALDKIVVEVEALADVQVGLTGNVTSAFYENESIMRGIVLASGITAILIALLLLVYFRAPLAVGASLWSLLVAVLVTFALTKVFIGHLNVMSSFLIAIVAGNGINSGLILLARYFEELRSGEEGSNALALAISGALRGTLTAAISAGVAYGALAFTEFRGFRHFGIIGSMGMVASWLSAFTVLPAGLCILRSWGRIKAHKPPALDRLLVFLSPKTARTAITIGTLALLAAIGMTVSFIYSEPFEKDWRNLRSESDEISGARALDARMKAAVGSKFGAGLTSRFVVAVQDISEVEPVLQSLNNAPRTLLKSSASLKDLLPENQEEKLQLLAVLRELTDEALDSGLSDKDKETAKRIRPPDELKSIAFEDIPEELSWPFVEKDGSQGKLILVSGADRFKSWSVDDRVELADGVRNLGLPEDALIGGQGFVIADIIASMGTDGPLASGVAIIGAIVAIFLLVGIRRHGIVTLVAGFAGTFGMIALCHLFGLKVNFLDLVALPITIGIGIDYSVNLAVRDMQDKGQSVSELLRTTGGAVLLCSLTTIIGYGSLMLSENAGIRSFGLAAMLGELACLTAAILLVPGLLVWLRKKNT
ncbi:MAG: MMPL family transporter [Kofleriaceae bacterium]|nr:MMPL family transporter [Kofleriaceae bacterium]